MLEDPHFRPRDHATRWRGIAAYLQHHPKAFATASVTLDRWEAWGRHPSRSDPGVAEPDRHGTLRRSRHGGIPRLDRRGQPQFRTLEELLTVRRHFPRRPSARRMTLAALQHLLRAAQALAEDRLLLVLGSASLLASHPSLGDADAPLASTYDADLLPEPFDELTTSFRPPDHKTHARPSTRSVR